MKFFKRVLVGFFLTVPWMAQANVEIQSWHTSKGANVVYVYAPQIPIVDIAVSFDAGSARDGKKWGLANMTAGLLASGTNAYRESAITKTFSRLGAQYGSSVDRDRATFTLRTLKRPENYQQSVEMFKTVLTDATFPNDVFQREQANLIEGLKQQKTKPSAVMSKAFWQLLYGEHPYAHPVSGTIKTVSTLTRSDITQFYRQYYVSRNATIAIVGDVNLAEAKRLAEKLTRQMGYGFKAPKLPEVKSITQAKTQVIPFPSSQTYYSLGQIGVKRGDPDYYALFLGNHLLGGSGFASMLMQTVREDRGLVYSVYSYFAPMKQPGPFVIGLSTKNASAKEADQVVQQTLKDFMAGKFSDEKLQAIKDNLIGGFPLRIDSNRKILSYISMIGFYRLPLDYLERFPKKIAQVSKEEVLEAWQRHIHPQKMIKVMVGEPK